MLLNLVVLCFVLAASRAEVVNDDVASKTETTDKILNAWRNVFQPKFWWLNPLFKVIEDVSKLKLNDTIKPKSGAIGVESTANVEGESKPGKSEEKPTQNVEGRPKSDVVGGEESTPNVEGESKPVKPEKSAVESTQNVEGESKPEISAVESTQNVKRETRPEKDGPVYPVGPEGFSQGIL